VGLEILELGQTAEIGERRVAEQILVRYGISRSLLGDGEVAVGLKLPLFPH
jgi:hypothetical protein